MGVWRSVECVLWYSRLTCGRTRLVVLSWPLVRMHTGRAGEFHRLPFLSSGTAQGRALGEGSLLHSEECWCASVMVMVCWSMLLQSVRGSIQSVLQAVEGRLQQRRQIQQQKVMGVCMDWV